MFSYENINPEQREGYYRERKRKYIEGYRKRGLL
jgi:guanyl-specific ribonuclease Sa